jgi:hypothetical protein
MRGTESGENFQIFAKSDMAQQPESSGIRPPCPLPLNVSMQNLVNADI